MRIEWSCRAARNAAKDDVILSCFSQPTSDWIAIVIIIIFYYFIWLYCIVLCCLYFASCFECALCACYPPRYAYCLHFDAYEYFLLFTSAPVLRTSLPIIYVRVYEMSVCGAFIQFHNSLAPMLRGLASFNLTKLLCARVCICVADTPSASTQRLKRSLFFFTTFPLSYFFLFLPFFFSSPLLFLLVRIIPANFRRPFTPLWAVAFCICTHAHTHTDTI